MNARRRGFTLIELLVVSAIAMVIFIVGFQLIAGTAAVSARGTARIRATESARVFFQMLERDITGAYPGPSSMIRSMVPFSGVYPASNVPIGVREKDSDGVEHDILQFYTKNDSPTVTDEYLFVRYYINRYPDEFDSTLNREVHFVTDPATEIPEITDPRGATELPNPQFALFDHADRLFVDYMLWNDTLKTMTKSATPENPSTWNHIRVTLRINALEAGKVVYQSFTKTFPIPDGFK